MKNKFYINMSYQDSDDYYTKVYDHRKNINTNRNYKIRVQVCNLFV